ASRHDANPRAFAEKKADALRDANIDGVTSISVAGPGFINFDVDETLLGREILASTDETSKDRDEKVIIEHTSPNPNKPLHMGTMRCAVLGDTVARLAERLGYQVEVQDYINDLGRQSARTVYAWQQFKDELSDEDLEEKDDFWIGKLYSKAGKYLEEHEDERASVQSIIQAIEEGDNETAALKDDIVERSLKGQLETAYRTNIYYDLVAFERDTVSSGLLEETVDQLMDLDRVYEIKDGDDAGCIVIDLSDYQDDIGEMKKPYKILFRSDGTATYTAKDIALTMWKFGLVSSQFGYEEFDQQPDGTTLWRTGGNQEQTFGDADHVINVVGAPQKFPMTVIEYSLRALGYEDEADQFSHCHFKFVYLPGKVSYSGRKGNWVGKHGDAVLHRCEDLAYEEVDQRYPEKDETTKELIAEKIAVAAVRYYLLRFGREKDIDFSFDDALDWEGDSGPYLLYSYARAQGILDTVETRTDFSGTETADGYQLLRTIEQFDTIVETSFQEKEPAKLANYLKRLAEDFNSFYHSAPVKDADPEIRKSRAALVVGFQTVMEQGLELLGAEPVEQM
ncbi:MAG: arginine--tRNA ligase, partial [Candidatus Nanohaloarchaeota archaeon QJJ-5]|nr:arginine--tRNA ligase [Candidatus Nanohaloarchaeota archaeon QJJ-5]